MNDREFWQDVAANLVAWAIIIAAVLVVEKVRGHKVPALHV